jgi:hypothetical protein
VYGKNDGGQVLNFKVLMMVTFIKTGSFSSNEPNYLRLENWIPHLRYIECGYPL